MSGHLLSVFYGICPSGEVKSVYAQRDADGVYLSTPSGGRKHVRSARRGDLRSEVVAVYGLEEVLEVPAALIGEEGVRARLETLKLQAAARRAGSNTRLRLSAWSR